jgi:hypothetical protein
MDKESASDKDGDGYAAAESEDELVLETIPQSSMTNWTRIKSRKVIITDALMSSDSEDELPSPQPRKHMHASRAPPSAGGHTKYFLRNSNHFLSFASKKLKACKESAGGHGRK